MTISYRCVIIGILWTYFPLTNLAADVTTSGNKVLRDGEPFFTLGVYYQRTGPSGHPAPWDELQNNGFNTINLMDSHPFYPAQYSTYYIYNTTYNGFISANQGNLPWLIGKYDNPANAQNILTTAAAHDILIIADQGPFTPYGGRDFSGSPPYTGNNGTYSGNYGTILRNYGVDAGNNSIIDRPIRYSLIDNLTLNWPNWGINKTLYADALSLCGFV